mmetsp:Transcript_23911/g.74751  ORF Transcript_23911/g.74751 Transcript_23911/m.74751 type:complete len:220 (+) Transcript_23911:1163-1822(+)
MRRRDESATTLSQRGSSASSTMHLVAACTPGSASSSSTSPLAGLLFSRKDTRAGIAPAAASAPPAFPSAIERIAPTASASPPLPLSRAHVSASAAIPVAAAAVGVCAPCRSAAHKSSGTGWLLNAPRRAAPATANATASQASCDTASDSWHPALPHDRMGARPGFALQLPSPSPLQLRWLATKVSALRPTAPWPASIMSISEDMLRALRSRSLRRCLAW